MLVLAKALTRLAQLATGALSDRVDCKWLVQAFARAAVLVVALRMDARVSP